MDEHESTAALIGEELDNTPHKDNAAYVEHFTRAVSQAIKEAVEAEREACAEAPVELKAMTQDILVGFVRGVNAKTASIRARTGG